MGGATRGRKQHEITSSTLTQSTLAQGDATGVEGPVSPEAPPAGSLGGRGGSWAGGPTLVRTALLSKRRPLKKREKIYPSDESTQTAPSRGRGCEPPLAPAFLCFGTDLCKAGGGGAEETRRVRGRLRLLQTKTAMCLHRRERANHRIGCFGNSSQRTTRIHPKAADCSS